MIYGIALAIGFVAAIFQLCTDPRITRQYLRGATLGVVLYLAYICVAIAGLIVLLPHAHDPHAVQTLFVAFLGWVGLGVLCLIRHVPRLRGQAPPAFLDHVGWPDAICLLVLIAGIATALSGF